MAQDVFMNIDALPVENVQVMADRLETRAQMDAFAEMRDQYFDAMALPEDARILELGGGTGIVGRAYASRDGFKGKYFVTDLSKILLDIGIEKAKADGLTDLMDFKVVDALTGEGLEDDGYDAVILHTLLSHVPDPAVIMQTASNAVKKGGIVAAFDADYASLKIESGHQKLDKKIEAIVKANAVAQPEVMRKLPKLAKDLGLTRYQVHPHFLAEVGTGSFFVSLAAAVANIVVAQGSLPRSDADLWNAALEEAVENDTFFGMCPYFTYLYRK